MTDTITITKQEYDDLVRRSTPLRHFLPDMKFMRAQGATLEQIAFKYGVTRQRIHQLLSEKPS